MVDLIRLDDVTVQFGPIVALDRVSIAVRAGEIVALIGPNGAGKSTALRVASGQLAPTAGTATIAGQQPAAGHSFFGVVPDKDNHFEEFSARRNLAFFAKLHDAPRARIDDVLQRVDLMAAADRPVREFSLGMRRRLLLARAFLHQPRVLLLDEPLANLDDPGQTVVTDLIQKARSTGAAVLYTAHGLNPTPFADRVAIIVRGKVEFSTERRAQ
jgi:ABC-2 type transport system ATP-binding protein